MSLAKGISPSVSTPWRVAVKKAPLFLELQALCASVLPAIAALPRFLKLDGPLWRVRQSAKLVKGCFELSETDLAQSQTLPRLY